MTLLEYLLTQELGEPLRVKDQGESYWNCPNCGSERFHSRPDKPPYKHRASCFKCGYWGDALDMLRKFHPGENYDTRKLRLAELNAMWLREYPSGEQGDSAVEAEPTPKTPKTRIERLILMGLLVPKEKKNARN